MQLTKLKLNQTSQIQAINNPPKIKQRLSDLGLIPGTKITPILNSPTGHIRAYLAKDTLLAIRDQDAQNIQVKSPRLRHKRVL